MLPKSAQKNVLSADNPIAKPRGIAPRNSVMGSIEEKNTISSGGMFKSFILIIDLITIFVLTQSNIKTKSLLCIQKLCNNLQIKQCKCRSNVFVYSIGKNKHFNAPKNKKLTLKSRILLTLILYILNLEMYLSDQKSYTHFVHKF